MDIDKFKYGLEVLYKEISDFIAKNPVLIKSDSNGGSSNG